MKKAKSYSEEREICEECGEDMDEVGICDICNEWITDDEYKCDGEGTHRHIKCKKSNDKRRK